MRVTVRLLLTQIDQHQAYLRCSLSPCLSRSFQLTVQNVHNTKHKNISNVCDHHVRRHCTLHRITSLLDVPIRVAFTSIHIRLALLKTCHVYYTKLLNKRSSETSYALTQSTKVAEFPAKTDSFLERGTFQPSCSLDPLALTFRELLFLPFHPFVLAYHTHVSIESEKLGMGRYRSTCSNPRRLTARDCRLR